MVTDLNYNEKELLVVAQKDDLAAFEKILSHYEKMIFNHVLRFVGRRPEAEDLTQEVFIKFYKNLKTVDPEKNFKAWLYKIATNTVYDWLRVQKRQKEISFGGTEEFETIAGDAAYIEIEDSWSTLEFEVAMSKIKPYHKNILMMFYRESLSYQEIAEALSRPINTIKTILFRAKQELKEILTKKDD